MSYYDTGSGFQCVEYHNQVGIELAGLVGEC